MASMMLAAWEVEPEAFSLVKAVVSFPPGRLLMKGERSTPTTERPSSARTLVASARETTSSRPSWGRWL